MKIQTEQIICAGTIRDVTIAAHRRFYSVAFPWGQIVKVGRGVPIAPGLGTVDGLPREVACAAARFAETCRGPQKQALLRYALRPGACNGEMDWACRQLGCTRERGRTATIQQARELAQKGGGE